MPLFLLFMLVCSILGAISGYHGLDQDGESAFAGWFGGLIVGFLIGGSIALTAGNMLPYKTVELQNRQLVRMADAENIRGDFVLASTVSDNNSSVTSYHYFYRAGSGYNPDVIYTDDCHVKVIQTAEATEGTLVVSQTELAEPWFYWFGFNFQTKTCVFTIPPNSLMPGSVLGNS